MLHFRFAALMATIVALAPLAIDTYLPAMTHIAADLQTSSDRVAVTVSLYIIGLALGQFIGGPLSDRHGRRPVLLAGLAVFAAGSVGLALSDSIAALWGARLLQALGGGLSAVVVPAMVRDRTEGRDTARLFALMGFIMILAPALAPGIGTLLLKLGGWRSIFVFLALYAAGLLLFIGVFLRTRMPQPPPVTESLWRRYRRVLSHGPAMGYVLAQGLAFGVMLTFLSNASFAYIEYFGQSEEAFSLLFAANVVTMALINRTNHLLLRRHEPARILRWALELQLAASAGLVLVTAMGPTLWQVVPLIMLTVGALGGVGANTSACCLHFFPRHSGTAAAVLGTGQYLIAALVSSVSTSLHNNSLWPMALTMAVAAMLALAAVTVLASERRIRRIECRDAMAEAKYPSS